MRNYAQQFPLTYHIYYLSDRLSEARTQYFLWSCLTDAVRRRAASSRTVRGTVTSKTHFKVFYRTSERRCCFSLTSTKEGMALLPVCGLSFLSPRKSDLISFLFSWIPHPSTHQATAFNHQ